MYSDLRDFLFIINQKEMSYGGNRERSREVTARI